MVAFDPQLYDRKGIEGQRRRQVVRVLEAALEAVDPAAAVKRFLRREGDTLWVADRPYDLGDLDRIYVVGAGKAGAPMAWAVEQILGERIVAGAINVKYGHVLSLDRIEITEAGHPIPDAQGVTGAEVIARLLQQAGARDLVIALISGGGSALMTLPEEGITLDDMQALTDALLRVGANIVEINTIRKHLEQLKGGGMAKMAYPARLVALILSDVVGNPLDAIASGPTVPDSGTFQEAWNILERYELLDQLPVSIVTRLKRGLAGEIPETPKAGDPFFERTQNVIVASNDLAALAAEQKAREEGFHSQVLTTFVEGEAREVAKVLAALAKEVIASERPLPRPACLIIGGETTVTVRGHGKGGRNQEMALSAALAIDGLDDVAIVCLATDGTDGPTDASGALADGYTIRRARAKGLDPWEYLRDNNAYPFFSALGDLLMTGPTNTNVNDLSFVFVWPSEGKVDRDI